MAGTGCMRPRCRSGPRPVRRRLPKRRGEPSPWSLPLSAPGISRGTFRVGTVTAFQTVTAKHDLDGQLTKVLFREGQFVKQGDVLAEIDPRPYEVQLAQAQGQMARDQAQLKDAEVNLERNKALFAAQVIAKQQLDTQASLVGQYQGAMASRPGPNRQR